MAVVNPCGFLQNAGATQTAEQLRNWHALLIAGKVGSTSLIPRGGVNPALGNALRVTQTGSPSMAVIVKSGHATIPGTQGSRQGVYSVLNDADVTLSIAAAHATLNRIDLVVFKVEDQAYSGSVNASSLAVVTGTPAGSPSAPTAPDNSIILAQVSIVALDSSITDGEITDRRTYMAGLGGLISVADTTERDTLIAYESLTTYIRGLDRIDAYDGAGYRSYYPSYRTRQTLGSTTATVTFSSIPSGLRSLRLLMTTRSTNAVGGEGITMRINGDTGSNYYTEYLQGNNASVTGTGGSAGTRFVIGANPGNNAPSGAFGPTTLDFTGWDAPHSNYLGFTSISGAVASTTQTYITVCSGAYTGAGPYTSIVLLPDVGSWAAGSDFQLIGEYT